MAAQNGTRVKNEQFVVEDGLSELLDKLRSESGGKYMQKGERERRYVAKSSMFSVSLVAWAQ